MGILKRTVFMERDPRNGKGFLRCSDWASVVTTIGQMNEPYMFNVRGALAGETAAACLWDSEDEIQRVDNVEWITDTSMNSVGGFVDPDGNAGRGKDGGHLMHGGWMLPRASGSR